MGLVAAKCPSCGAAIQIPEESDRCFCAYCGAQVLTEAAVNFARVEVTGTVQTRAADFDVQAGVLKAYRGSSTDVVIPEGVNTVDAKAFSNLPITSVTFPTSIKSVVFDNFRNISTLRGLYYAGPDNDWIAPDGILHSLVNRELLFYPPARPDEEYTVGTGIVKATIANNPHLRTLNFNESYEPFPHVIIENCPSLNQVNFAATGVASVKITNCSSLERLDLPGNVASVDVSKCANLKMITVSSPLDHLCIGGCPNACLNEDDAIAIPAGTAFAEVSSNRAKRLVVREGIRHLHVNCPALDYVEIGEGVEHFDRLHFSSPLNGALIKLPSTLSHVERDTFFALGDCTVQFPNIDNAVIDDSSLSIYRSNMWRSQKRCPLCGGKLRGLTKSKRCGACGQEVVLF